MKKIFHLILAILMVFSLSFCGGSSSDVPTAPTVPGGGEPGGGGTPDPDPVPTIINYNLLVYTAGTALNGTSTAGNVKVTRLSDGAIILNQNQGQGADTFYTYVINIENVSKAYELRIATINGVYVWNSVNFGTTTVQQITVTPTIGALKYTDSATLHYATKL